MYTMSSSRPHYILFYVPHTRTGTAWWRLGLSSQSGIHHRFAQLQLCQRSAECLTLAQERKQYEDSVNAYRDIINAIRTAEKKEFAKGRAKGKAEGIAEGMAKGEKAAKVKIAANLLSLGVPMKTIMQASGLSEEEIKNYCCPVKLLQAVFLYMSNFL